MQVEIILYPGDNKTQLDYFTSFFDTKDICYEINHCYFGYKILISISNDTLDAVSEHICRFVFDFYLKEAVISKVYDEYPCFNTQEASHILAKLYEKIVLTPLKNNILSVLTSKKSINPESYCLFNMKSLMLCIYALTDDICQTFFFSKEKEKLISLVQLYSGLSFNKCEIADVEFFNDNKCRVSFDKNNDSLVSNDELLPLLTQRAPYNVNIRNAEFSPELADIVDEIFNLHKNK